MTLRMLKSGTGLFLGSKNTVRDVFSGSWIQGSKNTGSGIRIRNTDSRNWKTHLKERKKFLWGVLQGANIKKGRKSVSLPCSFHWFFMDTARRTVHSLQGKERGKKLLCTKKEWVCFTWLEGGDQDDPRVQRGGHLPVHSLLSQLKEIENQICINVSKNSELMTGSTEESYRGEILGHQF